MTVKWETDFPTGSIVEWGRSPTFGQIASTPMAVTRHRIRLTRLAPETRYSYRVRSGDAVSAVASFVTAPPSTSPFRCVVYGDNREPSTMHRALIDQMVTDAPAMVLHLGDVCLRGYEVWRWKAEFFDQAAAMLRRAPFYNVIGNHEYLQNGYAYFANYFETPSPAPRGTYYAFTYGNARFIVLDSNWFDNPAQMTWLLNEFESADYRSATWRFVAAHHAPYYNMFDGGMPWMRVNLVPLLERYGVDIFFGAHAHGYDRGERNGVMHIITAGGGAPLFSFVPYWDFLTIHDHCYHYCVMDIDGENLRYQVLDQNRVVRDECVMTKRGRPFAIHEEFAYRDGGFVGKNGGSGWAGPWQKVSGTSPTISAQRAVLSGPVHLTRRFSASHGDGGTTRPYWIQAVVQCSGGTTAGAVSLRFGNALAVGQTAGRGFWGLSVGGSDHDSAVPVDGRVHRLVLKVVPSPRPNHDAVYFWVDPDDCQGPPRADVAVTGLSLAAIGQLTVQTAGPLQTAVDDIVLTYEPLLRESRNAVRRWQYY